jgi:hypothetical protein
VNTGCQKKCEQRQVSSHREIALSSRQHSWHHPVPEKPATALQYGHYRPEANLALGHQLAHRRRKHLIVT